MIKKIIFVIAAFVISYPIFANDNNDQTPTSNVYFTKEISPEGLVKIFEALKVEPNGRVAVKISTIFRVDGSSSTSST